MKSKFSTSWKASKQPRKQRKYRANAPIHLKRNFLSVALSKELRKKHERRSIPIRKDDIVKIIKGKFKGKQGKVLLVKIKREKIYIEGINVKKQEGSKVNVPLRAANLQIIELYLEDKKRMKKSEVKPEKIKENIEVEKKEVKKPASKKVKPENKK